MKHAYGSQVYVLFHTQIDLNWMGFHRNQINVSKPALVGKAVNQIMDIEANHQTTHWAGQIIVIGNDLTIRGKVINLITGAGGRIVNPLSIDFSPDDLEKRINAIAVVIHISTWDKITQKSLSSVETFCRQHDVPMLILLPLDLLDTAIVAIDCPNTEFLMTDEGDNLSAELLMTLKHKITETRSATFSNRDEPNLADLKKISEDVDRIARVLAQLTGKRDSRWDRDPVYNPVLETGTQSSVSDDPFGFKGEVGIASVPYGSKSKETQSIGTVTAGQIRNLLKARRLRDQYFDMELFADPAWDMLLDLMAARLENKNVSVSSLCIAASVPPTTALRWIKTMTEENIFRRRADDRDGRRIFIELSDDAADAMVGFFAMIRSNNLMMV